MRIFALIGLMLMVTPALADDPLHSVSPPRASQDAVTLQKFDASIEASTAPMIKAGVRGARFINYNIAFPSTADELRQMHGYGLLVVSAWSQDTAELPLKIVYLSDGKGAKIVLPLVGDVARAVPASSFAGKVYGQNRRDGFYLLPLDGLGTGIVLEGDFTTGRTGFIIAQDLSPPKYGAAVKSGAPPPRAVVQNMMDREYPGFGIPIAADFK